MPFRVLHLSPSCLSPILSTRIHCIAYLNSKDIVHSPTPIRPVAKKKKRLPFGKKRAQQRAARQEVLEEIKHNPIGGYGLYLVLDDAGLISSQTRDELAPLLARIEQRLHLPDEALKIVLPMPFEPVTDIEQDTLTSVIGQALREFARALPTLDESLRLPELYGINDMLKRHIEHTASIAFEVRLEQVLVPLLKHCGKAFQFFRADRMTNAQPGDFVHITRLKRSRQRFAQQFLAERRIQEGEVVQVVEVWEKGYLCARRLSYTGEYTQEWAFDYLDRTLPRGEHLTAIHKDEGGLYRLYPKYTGAVTDFIDLYKAHLEDHSDDPNQYRPTGPR